MGAPVLTGPPQLQRLFPTAEGPSPARRLAACMYASPVRISHQGQVFILLTPYDGHLTALLPSTDEVAWSLRLPLPAGLAPFIVATPSPDQGQACTGLPDPFDRDVAAR